ncbi:MAG: hypothetical protein MUO58_13975 [Anaerolineales bacterium]|nr:hypothetical protein [Anaerolineales bacterium]
MLEIRLLGEFDVRIDGDPVIIPSRPAQSLLAYLILNPGTRHRRERLAGLLWPESDESNARSNLRHALWRIRKTIGEGYLLADRVVIEFDPESEHWLDVRLLEDEISMEGDIQAALQAVSVYGGELLPGFYDNWVVLERERIRAVFEQRMQILLEMLVENGRWDEALEWCERWIALGHVPESAFRALMIAHHNLGNSANIAAVFQRCERAMMNELGVKPSPQTAQLYRTLIESDDIPPSQRRTPSQLPSAGARQESIRTLVDGWVANDVEILDLPSLALVLADNSDQKFGPEASALLIRSALQHGTEIEPWLDRVQRHQDAVAALMEVYRTHPPMRTRLQIVEGLSLLEGEEADKDMLRIVGSDDASPVKERAALAASKRGFFDDVVSLLLRDVEVGKGTSSLGAFVAIGEAFGIPSAITGAMKMQVALAIAQRRWRANIDLHFKMIGRGAIGGGLSMALIANAQLIPGAITEPDVFRVALNVMDLPTWILTNALIGMIWGGLFGVAVAFIVGLADDWWRGASRLKWRVLFGAIAGLIHSFFLISLSAIGSLKPLASASIYVPIYLLYGFAIGAALSFVVPTIGTLLPSRDAILRSVGAALFLAILAVPTICIVYQGKAFPSIFVDLIFALLFPVGLSFFLNRPLKDPSTIRLGRVY